MGVSPMAVFGYENHARDARHTGFSNRFIRKLKKQSVLQPFLFEL